MREFGKRKGGGRRCAEREAAPLTALLTTLTYSHPAVLIDVSRTGARLRGDDLPEEGEELMLSVERLQAFGTVVWSRDGECGVKFDLPLDQKDIWEFRRGVAERRGLAPELKAALDDWNIGLAR